MAPAASSAQPAAGYSKRTLIEKLGLKPGHRGVILNAPNGYLDLLGTLPTGVALADVVGDNLDFVQYFVTDRGCTGSTFCSTQSGPHAQRHALDQLAQAGVQSHH